jgi:hypothetical protein
MRALSELPTGQIDSVLTVLDEDVLAEVLLHIQGRPLLLMAGELHEAMQGQLAFTRNDESSRLPTPRRRNRWTGFPNGGDYPRSES